MKTTMNTSTKERSDAREATSGDFDAIKDKFGEIRMSDAVDAAVTTAELANALHRHAMGDWDDESGMPLSVLTVLTAASGTTIVLLTGAARSTTLLFLADEIAPALADRCGTTTKARGEEAEDEVRKFPLGKVVATPGARAALPPEDVAQALDRHAAGDWGDVGAADRRENDASVDRHLRILSVYHAGDGTKFWVITEADRSVTTVLLPAEY